MAGNTTAKVTKAVLPISYLASVGKLEMLAVSCHADEAGCSRHPLISGCKQTTCSDACLILLEQRWQNPVKARF